MNKAHLDLIKSTYPFFGGISDESVMAAIESLSEIPSKNLEPKMILSTSGGDADPGFAFFDTVQILQLDHSVTVSAEVGSIGLIVLLSAKPEKRFITKTGFLFLHEFGATKKNGEEIVVGSKNFFKLSKSSREGMLLQQNLYIRIVAERTGLKEKEVFGLMKDEAYLSPKKAVEYGFVSKIVESF